MIYLWQFDIWRKTCTQDIFEKFNLFSKLCPIFVDSKIPAKLPCKLFCRFSCTCHKWCVKIYFNSWRAECGISKQFFVMFDWTKKKTLYRADEKCIWIFFIVEPQSEQVMAEFSGYTLLTNKVRRDFIRLEPKGHQHNYYFHVGGFMKHFANVFALLYANCALANYI